MSKITRKIEIIPDIEGLTHDESNKNAMVHFIALTRIYTRWQISL